MRYYNESRPLAGDGAATPGAEGTNAVVPVSPAPSAPQPQAPALPRVTKREESFRAIRTQIEQAVADQLSHRIDLSNPEGCAPSCLVSSTP